MLYGKDTYARGECGEDAKHSRKMCSTVGYTAGYKTKQDEESGQRYATCLSTTVRLGCANGSIYVMGVMGLKASQLVVGQCVSI